MMELETVRLQRSGDRWWFQTEADLEEFLWLRGEEIFGWRWLARQLAIDGQFCDLVAVDRDGALVVLELKNEEEKYIVQQLTRYFHALIEARPFADVVDYSLPIRLLAIAPSFHRHSLTDRLYSILNFEFIQFEILKQEKFFCSFTNIESLYQFTDTLGFITRNHLKTIDNEAFSPPLKLRRRMSKLSEHHQSRIFEIRKLILAFDDRIQEFIEPSAIVYGNGKSNRCAELKINKANEPYVFLWLPNIRLSGSRAISRMKITSQDLVTVQQFHQHSIRGYAVKNFRGGKWSRELNEKSPKDFVDYFIKHRGWDRPLVEEVYAKIIKNPERANSLDLLIEISLDEWLKRINKR
jgi:hypothetical protein